MGNERNPRLAFALIAVAPVIAAGYVLYWTHTAQSVPDGLVALAIVAFRAIVEIIAAWYAAWFVLIAAAYLRHRQSAKLTKPRTGNPRPDVGLVYLCCGDVDEAALNSLARLRYGGNSHLIVHDDSRTPEDQARVAAAVDRIRRIRDVLLLRRPVREGGKPGAVNYVLAQTAHLYEYFILCDNDSIAFDPDCIDAALACVESDRTAVVQFRCVAANDETEGEFCRVLSRSIDAFHVFLQTWSTFAWRPFIGHNALLRTRAVLEVGGVTPGFFADDLDLTVRLNLRGYEVVYAPHIEFGERQPSTYAALRTRSYKWAYGCVQVLRAHWAGVLRSSALSVPEKLGFFQLAGFFVGQAILLVYLVVTCVIAPLVLGGWWLPPSALVVANLLFLTVYCPVAAYFFKEGRLTRSLGTVTLFAIVYGTTDLACARGVWDGLWRRRRDWVPTNSVSAAGGIAPGLGDALFGLLLLGVPAIGFPALLASPATYLWTGKFLFAPALHTAYRERRTRESRSVAVVRAGVTAAVVCLCVLPLAGAEAAVDIQDRNLRVDGQPFAVAGVHYGAWRLGTGPNKDYPYPAPPLVEEDLRLIRQLNANTILVVDAPAYVVALAQRHGLKVLYLFTVNWWALDAPVAPHVRADIIRRVRELQAEPALLGWVLGNEVPSAVLEQRGTMPIVAGLHDLYRAIKDVDRAHPVTHANWPPTKDLDLHFLDFVSFNLYPVWPPEVVMMGYGTYLRDVLQPIARDKPLLITEFGANTLEAGEEHAARVLADAWSAIRRDTAGGIVFEFADEPWKHYDNPSRPGSWWDRRPAPDDEMQLDADPEEHYGLVTIDRRPKRTFGTVSAMFHASSSGELPLVWFPVGAIIIAAAAVWMIARRSASGGSGTAPTR